MLLRCALLPLLTRIPSVSLALQILSLLCAALPDWGLTLEHLVVTADCSR
jgi:hypothetical protein